MAKHIKSPENIERAKTLKELGWSNTKIAKSFGVQESTIRKWLREDDPPEAHGHLEWLRSKNRERYVKEAWDIVFKLNEIVEDKINQGSSAFKSVRDAAVTMGVYFDKIINLETRGGKKQLASPININILPPSDGNPTRVIANPIQLSDESGQVPGDDSGDRFGENIRRLPEGDNRVTGESGDSGDDSGEYLQEPEGLHSPDADRGTMAEDEPAGWLEPDS